MVDLAISQASGKLLENINRWRELQAGIGPIAEATRLGAMARSAYKATKLRLRGGVIADIRARMEEDMRTLMNP